ncbi:hypothetical protein LZ30DRAFT_728225 [Colletotrichum cereale]|nr:hypothetical protein LZ30DRAFT_728225 [Colletotrichum cereale]
MARRVSGGGIALAVAGFAFLLSPLLYCFLLSFFSSSVLFTLCALGSAQRQRKQELPHRLINLIRPGGRRKYGREMRENQTSPPLKARGFQHIVI